MKRHIISVVFLLVAFMVGRASKAQLPANAATITGNGPVSTCAKPAPGLTFLCVGTDDIIASKNGGQAVSIFTGAVVTGVTSIAVNGGLPQTGAVTLTIPTKANSLTTTTIQ